MEYIDVTTTSVGREIIEIAYESFFNNIKFTGQYDFHITIDPAYGVEAEEIERTLTYLEKVKKYPCVHSLEITRFDKAIGLEGSLMVLLSQCHNRYGVHLEDDWRFFESVDLDHAINDLVEQNSCMIAFANTHLEKRETFKTENGVEYINGTHIRLQRLIPPNWACDYIPLAPNIHDNYIWNTAYITGLVYDRSLERCPEERTKEYVRSNGLRSTYNVLWTKKIVVEDIGRQWLLSRNKSKCIYPNSDNTKITDFEITSQQDTFKGFKRSEYLFERANKVIPGQTHTFMKRGKMGKGYQPLYADKGCGCYLIDVDGNRFIDYVAGFGVLQLGYCHPSLIEAVRSHNNKGFYFSLPTWQEIESAELLKEVIPNADMTRFLKSGGDACSAAVLLARYATGKNDILSCGYHGWHEQFQPFQPGAYPSLKKGLCEFDINQDNVYDILEKEQNRFSCVIIALPYKEPVYRETLLQIRRACTKFGALLILDDIVTGFRLAVGGVQEYYNIDADIVLLSKALTAGAELAAICGKSKYMKHFDKLYVSTTMAGEVTAMQCMINAITIYRSTDMIQRITELGHVLKEQINSISITQWGRKIITGYNCMPFLDLGSDEKTMRFTQVLIRNGIYMRSGCNFITGAHSDKDIEYTVEIFKKCINDFMIEEVG